MADQIRGEDWLPEGWKVEIRVRKSGKKDRYLLPGSVSSAMLPRHPLQPKYYTDPVNGYIFRSLKDIDRYLLSGKLGKHVTKNKPKNDLDSDNPSFDFVQHVDAPPLPKKKKLIRSNGAKKDTANDECKIEKTGAEISKEIPRKAISRSSNGGRTSRPKKKIESTPFFILDPDQCDDSSVMSIPNLSDIIDSMLKEKEGSKTVYLSAPAIGSLLGEKLLGTRNNNSHSNKKPKFAVNICKDKGISSMKLPTELAVKRDDWGSRSITTPDQQELSHVEEKKSIQKVAESKAKEEPDCPLFEDLFDDPCIDFAIKTLTGSTTYGA